MKPSDVSDVWVEFVESEVGHGSMAWDMIEPKEIIAAAMNFRPPIGSYRYDGTILVGDQFEWNAYGVPGWPNGHCFCEVVKLIQGEELLVETAAINSAGDVLHEENRDLVNDEANFREHVKLHRRPDGNGVHGSPN